MPKEGQIEAFDAGWHAHEIGFERNTVILLAQPSALGWAVMGYDCRAKLEEMERLKHPELPTRGFRADGLGW
jgi:hypothetical protein